MSDAPVIPGVAIKSGDQIVIRWLIRRDVPEFVRIEALSFAEPWTEDDLTCVLRQRNCIGMVCESVQPGRAWPIIGYMIYELHKSRLVILNMAVDPAWRRRGVGTAMIERLRDKLSQQRRSELLVEVRETNVPAQLFLQSQAFKAISVLRNHFETEDAYLMQLRVPAESKRF